MVPLVFEVPMENAPGVRKATDLVENLRSDETV